MHQRAAQDKSFVSCEARVTGAQEVVAALAEAWSAAMREVYVRVVLHKEPWFVPSKGNGGQAGGVRAELIGRGWSQREAESMLEVAKGAQDAAVESAKLALEKARDQLGRCEGQLAWAMAGRSERRMKRRHGLARRRDRLSSRVARLQSTLDNGEVRVCFGGRKLAKAGNDPGRHGFKDKLQWRATWERARNGTWSCHVDHEFVGANSSAHVLLSEDGAHDAVALRVPGFLRESLGVGEWVEVPVKGFVWRREALAAAMAFDDDDHQRRQGAWAGATSRWDLGRRLGMSAAGLRAIGMKKPPASPPRRHTAAAVSVRLVWREQKGGWYVVASFERPGQAAQLTKVTGRMVLGVDLNPGHIAWCLVSPDGDPLRWGRATLDLTGSSGHISDVLGVAVAGLVRLARRHGAVVAHEELDFSRKRSELRYLPNKLAKKLSSFAYAKFAEALTGRCAREGVGRAPVDPAWTSVLGQANYAGTYGVSVDQGAACVIARRALGLPTSVRPWVSRCLPGSAAAGTTSLPEVARLKLVAKALSSGPHKPGRRSTWDPSGLCLRHSAPAKGPQGKGIAAPAQCSPSTPKPAPAGTKVVPCSQAVAAVNSLASHAQREDTDLMSLVFGSTGFS